MASRPILILRLLGLGIRIAASPFDVEDAAAQPMSPVFRVPIWEAELPRKATITFLTAQNE